MAGRNSFAVCVILIIGLMMFAGCTRRPPESEPVLGIGKPAPNFKLPDLSGQQVSLNQFKGKIVLMDFWATWCGPCRKTMPIVENLQKEYADSMVLLTINLQETQDVVRDYIRSYGIHSRVLLDEEGAVAAMFGAAGIPMQILIDKEGIVRFAMTGYGSGMASTLRSEINKLR